jgi:hypothetical protein
MAQRSYQPPRNRRNNNNSPYAIVAASILLVVVAAIVAWILFFYDGANGDNSATPSSSAIAALASPSGSATAQPSTAASVAASAVASASTTGSATAGATPQASASAQETATVQPTATTAPEPTPLVGDYGSLPAADIPSGSSGGGQLQLSYHLNMSLQQVPQQAPVYQLQPRVWSADDAASLAQSLGITGDVQDQGNGSFRASGNGELYISNSLVQYIAPAGGASGTPTSGGQLPDNGTLVQTARGWLLEQDLLGASIGPGAVTSRDEANGVAQVQFKPVEPDGLLSAIPSANVTIGASGAVAEAFVRWPAAMPRSTYGLRSASALWQDASSGRGYIEINNGGAAVSGDATITSASLAYTTAGDPGTKQYLVPLVVFAGQVSDGTPIKIYVSAVGAQAAPRG